MNDKAAKNVDVDGGKEGQGGWSRDGNGTESKESWSLPG